MKLEVLNINGSKTGKQIDLDDNIFGIEPNDHVLYLSVKQYLANQRQGTHKVKQRGETSGSTKKLHKQKGTGGSRKGSIKNPVFGNGRTFGPEPRDYSFKLNKKVKALASKSALSYKVKDNEMIIVEDFTFNEAKTKNFTSALNNLGVNKGKSCFVLSSNDMNVILSGRNIFHTHTVNAVDLNVYQVMNCNKIVISESAVKVLTERLSAN
ncbi:MAG: 50S ribosomal protein L4 [Bacteroidetes bacterium]|nr:50S ribosomal protein L4 [Bacteroidota bacterium]